MRPPLERLTEQAVMLDPGTLRPRITYRANGWLTDKTEALEGYKLFLFLSLLFIRLFSLDSLFPPPARSGFVLCLSLAFGARRQTCCRVRLTTQRGKNSFQKIKDFGVIAAFKSQEEEQLP